MRTLINRRQAGRSLALRLSAFVGRSDVIVLALPRGGVPVAYEIARALRLPLDVLMVRKLGMPGHEELAMGAIATGEVCVLNSAMVRGLNIQPADVDRVVTTERRELNRREAAYRAGRPPLRLDGRTVILVDDGLATGATMHAAITAVVRQHAASVVVAVPVASREAVAQLADDDRPVATLLIPEPFVGVAAWYEDFAPTSDDEVRSLLAAAWREEGERTAARAGAPAGRQAVGRRAS